MVGERSKQNALTLDFPGRTGVLISEIYISLPVSTHQEAIEKNVEIKKYKCIWDTGATNCVITKKIVDGLSLKPIGVAEVHHAQGKTFANKYLVNIILPNKVVITDVTVTEGILGDLADVLVGMDIITLGDFAVTNENGQTTMSFRVHSFKRIDFVPESNQHNFVLEKGTQKMKKDILENEYPVSPYSPPVDIL